MEGTFYVADFITSSNILFEYLKSNVNWHQNQEHIKIANYSTAHFNNTTANNPQEFTPLLLALLERVSNTFKFTPNNCFIYYLPLGSQNTNITHYLTNTITQTNKVAIVALGHEITLQLSYANKVEHLVLAPGAVLYIPESNVNKFKYTLVNSFATQNVMLLTFV